jgi:hypothetical protein
MSVLAALGTIGGLVLDGVGMFLDSDSAEAAARSAEFYNSWEMSIKERELAATIDSNKEKIAFDKREAKRKWAWMEEDRNYGRAKEFATTFQTNLDKDASWRNNLVNIWHEGQSQ